MKHKLLTLFLLAACFGTLSGCASTKKSSEQNIPVQADTEPKDESASKADSEPGAGSGTAPIDQDHIDQTKTDEQDQGLTGGSPKLSKSSATMTLYLESDSGTTLAYIDAFDGKQLAFDDAEWVDVPSDRAKELGVEKEAADAGFYIYNEDTSLETLPVAPECECTILDWYNSYEPKEITVEELPAILEERADTHIPYLLTFEGQEIVKIEEHYVP
ncbi:MAG: hypothetical protein K2N87_11460 [Eubacterium sp.]|nr:hypothetical protein [Eubacterium sp.]